MFKLLRSRAKFFYWIIASSFILFTFIVWGAQCNQNPRQPTSNLPAVAGSVDGRDITWQEWDNSYRNYLQQYQQQMQGRQLTQNQVIQAADMVWDQLVRIKLSEREIERRGLGVSDAEILDAMRYNPPAEILQQYATPEGGVDMDAYLADLANPERDWTGFEAYLRSLLPQQKLMQELTAHVVVTEEDLREEYVRQNGRGLAEYLNVNFADITLEDSADPARLRAYYDAHNDEFEEPAKVVVEVVSFPKVASQADEDEILQMASEIRQEILDGVADFGQAAATYSDDEGTRENGGDLGFFDRDRMVAPFADAAFSLPIGEISAPIKTDFGYHLIEVLEHEEEDGELARVHARHILFEIAPGQDTIFDILETAEAFVADARDVGFSEAAADMALEVQRPAAVRRGWDLPGLRNTARGNIYAFDADLGDVSDVFQNDEAYYAVHVVEKLEAGVTPFEEVEAQVAVKVDRERKIEIARERMNPALGALQMGRDFADVAAEFELGHALTDTFALTGNVAGVGYNTEFNTAVIEHAAGETVENVETQRGLFSLVVLWKSELDEEAFGLEREPLRARLLNQRQQEAMSEWLDAQVEAAEIVDNRAALSGGS